MGKRLTGILMLSLIILGACFRGMADEIKPETVFQEYAQAHGQKLNVLLDCQEYLDMSVALLYPGDDGRFLSALSEIDFTDPRKMLVLIRQRNDIELLRNGVLTDDARAVMEKHAFFEICLTPLTVVRPEHELYARRVIEDLIVRDAAVIPQLDGAAYVVQLYDDVNGEESPFLVTAFIASEPGNVLVHSEIVCGKEGVASVEDRFVNFMILLDECIGPVSPEDFVQYTFREPAQNP